MKYKASMAIAVSIVEDDAQARKILAGWINRASGFHLAGDWGDAESALRLLPEKNPNVVLMDINLPGISGVEAVKRLKPLLPATQFVMLTVYEDADHIYNALAAGATGYLLKQTPRAELLGALEEVHRGGSPMTSNIARKVVQAFKQTALPVVKGEELSAREQEVLDLLARGYLYKEIAERLNISQPTVNTYVRRMYEKLHVRSRAQAVAKYARLSDQPVTPAGSARVP
ncbi:Two component transcriptional regulator, LuxR family [Verrucomicrobia bacterium]|nr:Two component transcriptional regulator, LuxR family [Verrucomicrobiota bacterium]